ncbi:MAG TPA: NAD(P)/FAD-dependent oxidoreductase [Spirochaetota bacterium]|nr:NAD(P)/FAD-dependent oxidoreductase [Spirochaetota bacterium]
MSNKYDVIIIGSGAGSLIAGAFLCKSGYRVLTIERHIIPGGYLHGFKRKGFFFDSAVYSLAGCGDNGYITFLLEKLALRDKFEFKEYEAIYKVKLPFGEYTLPTGFDNFKGYLAGLFPAESENINRMMGEALFLYNEMEFEKFGKPVDEKKFFSIIQKWGKKSYKDFIDAFISDDRLRKILYSLWLYCALPEGEASSLYGVLMLMIHIIESSHYINGGCDNLAKILADYIVENNGEIRYSSEVKEILIKDDLAYGVRLQDGTELYADVVISNANAKDTLKKFVVNPENLSNIIKRRIDKLIPSISTFALYIVAKINPDVKSPFSEANQIFFLDEEDNENIYKRSLEKDREPFGNLLITEIPGIQKEGYRTYNVYSLMSFDRYEDWGEVKKTLSDKMLDKVKSIVKDYWSDIFFVESATPKTFYRYTLNTCGSMYGFENTSDAYRGAKMENSVGVKNLFLAGHWTKPGGSVYNAMTSGMKAFELAKNYLAETRNG